jgi:YfiH family protein
MEVDIHENLLIPGWANGDRSVTAGFTTPAFGNQALTRPSVSSGSSTRENRQLLADTTGFAMGSLISPHQVHGNRVLVVSVSDRGKGAMSLDDARKGDALVTMTPGILLIVSWADCIPVILYDSNQGICAAVHSGWKGTAGSIVIRTIEEMIKLGGDPATIRAAAGPGIRGCCYSVGEELLEPLSAAGLTGFFQTRNDKLYFDLAAAVYYQLQKGGIVAGNIDWPGICTSCSSDPVLFSCRRDGKDKFEGQAAFIGMK